MNFNDLILFGEFKYFHKEYNIYSNLSSLRKLFRDLEFNNEKSAYNWLSRVYRIFPL